MAFSLILLFILIVLLHLFLFFILVFTSDTFLLPVAIFLFVLLPIICFKRLIAPSKRQGQQPLVKHTVK